MSDPERAERKWTILDLLRWTSDHFVSRGIETARLDAECLLASALGTDRLRLYLDYDMPVEAEERGRFRSLVQRRANDRVPVAQLVGKREFWSLELEVNGDVLTPRPETETLVQVGLDLIPDAELETRVLDLGTGTGAVAIALARERPKASVLATDISPRALAVARRNVERHDLTDCIRLLPGSLFEPVAGDLFDLIVSNPPYLAEGDPAELPPELAHEPRQALYAGADGLAVLRPLAEAARGHLAERGGLALELAPEQAGPMESWLGKLGFENIRVHLDLAGRRRVVSARRLNKDGDL